MIITLISAFTFDIALTNRRIDINKKYTDKYKLNELEEILSNVNLYLKNNALNINEKIKSGNSIDIGNNTGISIIYSKNYDKIQINYIYNGISKGRFFSYKYIANYIVLIPDNNS